jgi:hypothetical protein
VQKYEVVTTFHFGVTDSCIGDLNLTAAFFDIQHRPIAGEVKKVTRPGYLTQWHSF